MQANLNRLLEEAQRDRRRRTALLGVAEEICRQLEIASYGRTLSIAIAGTSCTHSQAVTRWLLNEMKEIPEYIDSNTLAPLIRKLKLKLQLSGESSC